MIKRFKGECNKNKLEILKEIKIDGKSFYELKMYAKKPCFSISGSILY